MRRRTRIAAAVAMTLASATSTRAAPGTAPPAAADARASAGLTVRTGQLPGDVTFLELAVDLAKVRVEVVLAPTGASLESLAGQARSADAGTLATLNGGYWDRAYRPTGWLVSGGRTITRRNGAARRSAAFWIAAGEAHVTALADAPATPELAVQNSPLLRLAGRAADLAGVAGRRAARTLVCLGDGGALSFLLLRDKRLTGPTLEETATLAAAPRDGGGFGCRDVLNLDGGPSTGVVFPEGSGYASMPAIAPIGYALALKRR
jgi:hypothetical protein